MAVIIKEYRSPKNEVAFATWVNKLIKILRKDGEIQFDNPTSKFLSTTIKVKSKQGIKDNAKRKKGSVRVIDIVTSLFKEAGLPGKLEVVGEYVKDWNTEKYIAKDGIHPHYYYITTTRMAAIDATVSAIVEEHGSNPLEFLQSKFKQYELEVRQGRELVMPPDLIQTEQI